MAYGEFSEGFKEYRKLRDDTTAGLERCDFLISPENLEDMGFDTVKSAYFDEDGEEHELHEFVKDGCRVVYLQTYIEEEGGMYIQGLFASPGCIGDLRRSAGK